MKDKLTLAGAGLAIAGLIIGGIAYEVIKVVAFVKIAFG